jgi:hypothetical protein
MSGITKTDAWSSGLGRGAADLFFARSIGVDDITLGTPGRKVEFSDRMT